MKKIIDSDWLSEQCTSIFLYFDIKTSIQFDIKTIEHETSVVSN